MVESWGSNNTSKKQLTFVWLDSDAFENDENLETQQELYAIADHVEIFTDSNVCEEFIRSVPNQRLVLFASGRLGLHIIPRIHQLKQIIAIYIYCINKTKYEQWTKDFDKIKAVIVKRDELVHSVLSEKKNNVGQLEENSSVFVIPQHSQAAVTHNPVTTLPQSSTASTHDIQSISSSSKEYEQMPLVSIETATAPLMKIVPNLEQMVTTAKSNCYAPDDGLSSDESASIMLYTMEWSTIEPSFCYFLNRALNSNDEKQLRPWFHYLKLISHALAKLKTQRRTIYRVITEDVSRRYQEGNKFVWSEFISGTTYVKALDDEKNFSQGSKRTLFTIECETGKDISRHTFSDEHDDILLIPGRQFEVVACLDPGDGLRMIQIKEVTLT
ncbi:unnamed protein product [Rotaria sordida]|uniref:NAD(P)(+)--arginine ADP-ribosyltransferase n=1 Tax=Rotaria sordida TaxID=392033 RepID=A0A819KID3_9BILA|nr:unnamed protein product [Rotaria sordida]CAF3945623.1 unnamed protein product [Rotaria sordida]